MKNNKLLLTLALVGVVSTFTGCGETSTSSVNTSNGEQSSQNSQTSVEEPSSVYVPAPTEQLTDNMLAELKLGYEARSYHTVDYTDSKTSYVYDVRAIENVFGAKRYSTVEDQPTQIKNLIDDYQYELGDEKNPYLYETALSVGNEVMGRPIMGRDPFTGEEVNALWSECYLDNFFESLTASDFTRVGTENKFALNLSSTNVVVNNVGNKLIRQLISPDLTWGPSMPNTSVSSFYILTDGDKIVGFELTLLPYLSGEAYTTHTAFGDFTNEGLTSAKEITPLVGEEDPDFVAAINKLKAHNYKLEQRQSGVTMYDREFNFLGSYDATVEDGEKMVFNMYNAKGDKLYNFGYYDLGEIEGQACKQGVTQIKDNFYKEFVYINSVRDYLPEFSFSSLLFNKNEELSTDTKKVWELNKDIKISKSNDTSNYTPFDIDGYCDRTIYLTITAEEDKITIHNETSLEKDAGLSIDVVYSNLGKVENLIPESSIKETSEGLTWTDLVSNRQADLNSVLANYTEEVINALPMLPSEYCLVNLDATTSNKPIFYTVIYDEKELDDLVNGYGETLLNNGYTFVNEVEEEATINYTKDENVVAPNGREYSLNVAIRKFWNGNPGYEYGQFQIVLSYAKAH